MPYIDKEKVKRHFSRSALQYDEYAILQNHLAQELVHRLDGLKIAPAKILDVGTGTAFVILRLLKKFPKAQIWGLDIAPGMVKIAASKIARPQIHFLEGDAEALPFPDQSFDLVTSNAALQWTNPLLSFFQAFRVLKPNGYFIFTTFGPRTLSSLREIFPVHNFPSAAELLSILKRLGFRQPQIDKKLEKEYYKNSIELLKNLKNLGAAAAFPATHKGLGGRQNLAALKKRYPEGIEAVFEVYLCQTQK